MRPEADTRLVSYLLAIIRKKVIVSVDYLQSLCKLISTLFLLAIAKRHLANSFTLKFSILIKNQAKKHSQALWKRYFYIKAVLFSKIIRIFAVFFLNV